MSPYSVTARNAEKKALAAQALAKHGVEEGTAKEVARRLPAFLALRLWEQLTLKSKCFFPLAKGEGDA